MIELAVALVAGAALVGSMWWYDARGRGEWEALLSHEARQAQEVLRAKFRAEERAVSSSLDRAEAGEARLAEAAARFIAGTVPERLRLLRRLELYWRLVSGIVPPPAMRLRALQAGFQSLIRPGRLNDVRAELRALDAETLEACGVLLSVLNRVGERNS
jgi:hypothetical protein